MKKVRVFIIFIIAIVVSLVAILGPILNYISFDKFSIVTFLMIGVLQILASIDFFKEKNIKICIISSIGSIASFIIVIALLIRMG